MAVGKEQSWRGLRAPGRPREGRGYTDIARHQNRPYREAKGLQGRRKRKGRKRKEVHGKCSVDSKAGF